MKRIAGFCLAMVLIATGVFAAGVVQDITAQLSPGLSVVIDGEKQTFKDANGNVVYPIVYNGTTYLPLRAIGGVMGKEVSWDGGTQTATLGKVESAALGTTAGQKNALAKAKKYLEIMSFSYKGLIDQLKYEKFSAEDATFGVDNCGANWSEQAVKKAKNYLDIMSFSREGLIDQLKFDGFTQEQAAYGATQNGF